MGTLDREGVVSMDGPRCTACGRNPAIGAHGLCRSCIHDRTVAERAAQGLPPTVEDPIALGRVVEVMTAPGPHGEPLL